VARVQAVQVLVARELVEGFGLSEREAADLLGLVPSAVSQYLSGKRLGPTVSVYLDDEAARRIARRTAQSLVSGAAGGHAVLAAAIELADRFGPGAPQGRTGADGGLRPGLRRELPRWLRARIAGEQNAVAECMRLAQRSRDELTRSLFRQIAADSLRHAEIVAALASYLDRGVATSAPTGITRRDVEHLLRREHEAEVSSPMDLGPELGGMMRILWNSMESDERKHEHLLELLLEADLSTAPGRSRKR
jgi:transcriptional regulator with XRE-family HTH domain